MTKSGKLIVGLVIVFILLLSSVRIIGVGKVGIVTRFGNVNREVGSGLHLKIPFAESIHVMNVQLQKSQVDAEAATNDLQTVTASIALNYNLTSDTANKVYKEVGVNYVSTVIDPILQETVKSVSSQYNATDLIDKRTEVQTKTFVALQSALQKRGITVDNLSIVNFKFSDQFAAAIEAKQVEAQNVQAAQYKLQKAQLDAEANQVQDAALTPAILEQQAIAKWNGQMPKALGTNTVFGIDLQGSN